MDKVKTFSKLPYEIDCDVVFERAAIIIIYTIILYTISGSVPSQAKALIYPIAVG